GYSERFPMQFTLAAELDTRLDEQEVKAALAAAQRRHPLLSVHVEDHLDTRLGFYRAASAPAIELRVLEMDWRRAAERELAHPFDRGAAPLMRAVLVTQRDHSTLLLTFDHVIADGMSAVRVLDDVMAALNGVRLETLPVPPSQEQM